MSATTTIDPVKTWKQHTIDRLTHYLDLRVITQEEHDVCLQYINGEIDYPTYQKRWQAIADDYERLDSDYQDAYGDIL